MENLKRLMNSYIDLIEGLQSFNDQKVNEKTRGELKVYLENIDKELFTRLNVGKTVVIRLNEMIDQLAEVIVIGSHNNKIWVNADRLWGTIEGLNERILEMNTCDKR